MANRKSIKQKITESDDRLEKAKKIYEDELNVNNALRDERKQMQMKELFDILDKKGLTVSQIIAEIQNSRNET